MTTLEIFLTIIGIFATLSTILNFISSFSRNKKKDVQTESIKLTEITNKLDHLSVSQTDQGYEIKNINNNMSSFKEAFIKTNTILEEHVKNDDIHHRSSRTSYSKNKGA